MTATARLEAILHDRFSPSLLQVVDQSEAHRGHIGSRPGGETHFMVTIKADAFAGMSRIERHRAVYAALSDEIAGGIHALTIKASAAD